MAEKAKAMNIADSAPKLEVNQRLPLPHYYRIAENLLRQAKIYRNENNVIELYILLLRFTSLVTDTIAAHNDYRRSTDQQKALLRKKVLEAVSELENLKPVVQTEWRKRIEQPKPVQNHTTSVKYDPVYEISDQQKNLSVSLVPRDETVSRHSYFNFQKPRSRTEIFDHPIKVQYPRHIDLSHIEIPSLDQDRRSVSSSQSTIEDLPSLPDFRPRLDGPPFISQYDLVNQLSPPPLAAPVQRVHEDATPLQLRPSAVADPRPGPPRLSDQKGPKHLHVSTKMMEEFLALARFNTEKNLETCGVLAGSLEKGIFSVTTLIVPKQEATSDSVGCLDFGHLKLIPLDCFFGWQCQTINEEELFEVQDERNLFQLGWIHTHPTQTCFMSSIDLHTHYSYQVMLQEAIAIVMAPTDQERTFGIFRLSEPGGMKVLQQCDQRGFHPHEEPADGGSIYDHCSHVYMNPSLRFDIVDLR